jgi:hypothetical protein
MVKKDDSGRTQKRYPCRQTGKEIPLHRKKDKELPMKGTLVYRKEGGKLVTFFGEIDVLQVNRKKMNLEDDSVILVNLTGHDINYKDIVIIPEDVPLRVSPEKKLIYSMAGIEFIQRNFNITPFEHPEIRDGIFYIVSFKVLLKLNREDFIVPIPIKRNGSIIGCKGFFSIK